MSGISTGATLEECADELNDFLAALERYPHAMLALALRAQLCGLLQALWAQGEWSAQEVAAFIGEMAGEALEAGALPES